MAETRSNNKSGSRGTSQDRNLVSNQPWEVETIHKHFPNHTHQQVVAALEQCKKQLNGSEDRTRIMECLNGKLTTGNGK